MTRIEVDRFSVEQAIESSAVHQVGTGQAGEGERAFDGVLCELSQPEQQKGDQCDGDLDAHSIFGGAEKAPDLEGLLDPAEEQLDGPTPLVEIGDLLRAASRSLDRMRMTLPVELTRTSRTGS